MKDKIADKPFEYNKNVRPVINEENYELLKYYIKERYNIMLKKESGQPKPWTDDEILQNYRFTNVRREHDKVTKWVINNIVNADISYRDKILNLILFRTHNRIETGEVLELPIVFDDDFSPEDYREKCSFDMPYFTAVFQTVIFNHQMKCYSPNGDETLGALNPFWFIKYLIDTNFVENYLMPEYLMDKTPKYVCNKLTDLKYIGRFYANQFYIDFTYVEEFPFSENHFIIAGPGCEAGLKILFENFDGLTLEEALVWTKDKLNKDVDFDEIFVDLPAYDQCMNITCLEHVFCEYFKYFKTHNGTGRLKQRYPGL